MIMKTTNRTVRSIPANQLTAEHVAAWARIQEADATLVSPYFRPEFTQAVASVRSDVEVAIFEESGEAVGFFPFQRRRFQFGKPVGGRLSDFHGAIVAPGVQWTVEDLLTGCGLRGWDFTQLPTSQSQFAANGERVLSSSHLDLSQGFAQYESDRRAMGNRELKQILRKSRKIERDFDSVRYEWQSAEIDQLHQLMEWKSQQYRRTGIADVFSFDWTRQLLETLLQQTGDQFGGVLSTLSVNDEPIAMHFGMRSRGILHYWFPVYNVDFEKYSPGLLLLIWLARTCEDHGITRIDLGEGVEQYKRTLSTGSTEITQGSIESSNLVRSMRQSWKQTRNWIKTSPLAAPARMSAKVVRPLKDWLSFQ